MIWQAGVHNVLTFQVGIGNCPGSDRLKNSCCSETSSLVEDFCNAESVGLHDIDDNAYIKYQIMSIDGDVESIRRSLNAFMDLMVLIFVAVSSASPQ